MCIVQVSLEFYLVMKDDKLQDKFHEEWDLWSKVAIEYALQVQNKPAQLKHALRDLDSDYEVSLFSKQFACVGRMTVVSEMSG